LKVSVAAFTAVCPHVALSSMTMPMVTGASACEKPKAFCATPFS
jgi:hypothetical protein